MAIHIKITKYAEDASWHFYEVLGDGFEKNHFFMAVNSETRELYFYSDVTCSNLIKRVDLSHEEEPLGELPGVKFGTYARAVMQIYKALKKNEFPYILDFCA